jgi:hypothetical protein
MDFEDYALGGVGAGAGLALGGGVIGKYIGNKWGEDAYYRSKARSLGRESDASVDYDQQSRTLLESNLPEKQKIRELQKLKVQRDRIIGDSTRNKESDAEVSRWLNKAKGIGVGTLGAGAVGGAIGLGYGLNNDFSGDKQHFANFFSLTDNVQDLSPEELTKYIEYKNIIGSGVLGGLAGGNLVASLQPNKDTEYDNALNKVDRFKNRIEPSKKYKRLSSSEQEKTENRYYGDLDNLNRENTRNAALTGLGIVGGGLASAGAASYLLGSHFNKNNKNMTKFTRKHNSTYIQFKRAYNKAVAEFGVLDAIRGSSVKQRLGAGAGLAGLAGGGLLAYKALRGETPDIDFEGLRQQAEGYGGQAGKYLGDLRQQGQQYIDGNENIRNLREQGKAYGAKAGKYLSQQGGYLRDKIESRVPLPPQWNGDYQSPVGIPQSITGEEVGYSPQSIGSYNDYQAPSAIPQSLTGQKDNSKLYHATKILRESGRNRYQG